MNSKMEEWKTNAAKYNLNFNQQTLKQKIYKLIIINF